MKTWSPFLFEKIMHYTEEHIGNSVKRTYSDGTIVFISEPLTEPRFHREVGPAVIRPDGSKEWWINGLLHRADGPAVENSSGEKEWFFNGTRHRIGGPAYERAGGIKEWYKNGKLHREDGPAYEHPGGYHSWHYNGKEVKCASTEEFIKLIKLKAFW